MFPPPTTIRGALAMVLGAWWTEIKRALTRKRTHMRVIRDGVWLCVDCLMVAVNGDATGLDFHYKPDEAKRKLAEINAGLSKLGPNLVPAFDSETNKGIREFSNCGCDCCGSRLAGEMHEFAILGPDEEGAKS